MYVNNARVFNETNCLQRKDAEITLNEYMNRIEWPDRDSVLQIGSRTGDVLFDFVFQLLPQDFRHVVGIDRSEAMVSHAIENYRHPKLFFEQADIVNRLDIDKLLGKYGQFDHISTFCSLHWVMNQELAFKNIFDLLAPNGDILATIFQHHPLFEHYKEMMTLEKWNKYREQMVASTSPYFYSSDPVKMLKEILERVGFRDIHVELTERQHQFENKVFIDSTTPAAPFLCHVPETLRREFLSTYENKVMETSRNIHNIKDDQTTIVTYRMLTAYAKRGVNTSRRGSRTITVFKKEEVRMHNAQSYHETNCMQRKDALDTIIEHQNNLQWASKEDDILLDIGTGSGDVTFDYILPLMPPNSRLVASDKAPEMVKYASENFSHSRITYEKLDIEKENEVNEILNKYGQFNHITSFCCLHWALKQSNVMNNIFHLLQNGGDVLLTIDQHHPIYEHYADMSELPKWSKYRADMKKCTSPYFRNENPEKELFEKLESAGFVDINVVLKNRLYPYNKQIFIDSIFPIMPFLDKMSELLKGEFIQIYMNKINSMKLPAPYKPNTERNDGITMIPYRILVAHARKPTTLDTRI